MSKPELLAAIRALGWHRLTSSPEKATAFHADHPLGWQVFTQPSAGEEAVLAAFLRDIQTPELLAKYA